MQIAIELTDPAKELAELAERLRTFKETDVPAYKIYAQMLGVDSDSFGFLELLGAIGSRIHEFSQFVATVDDPYISPRTREHTLASVSRLAALFQPQNIGSRWLEVKNNYSNEADIVNLELFSARAREYKPLRKLSEEDRKGYIARFEELIIEIDDDKDLPVWAKPILKDGIQRLIFILRHIIAFGSDRTLDAIFAFHQQSAIIEAKIIGEDVGESKSKAKTLRSVLHVVVAAAELFVLPYHAGEAWDHYKGNWMVSAITGHLQVGHTEQKLLEGPKHSTHNDSQNQNPIHLQERVSSQLSTGPALSPPSGD